MSQKAEISWKRDAEDGTRVNVYARHFGGVWRFYTRGKRYDQWQENQTPPLEDWTQLLACVRRRIGRGLLNPDQELKVLKLIKERHPEAPVS